MIVGRVPWTTNITPGGFDEQRFQKGRLKGALFVVIEAVVVATTTATPWNFDTRSRVRLPLCAALGVFAFMYFKFA